MSDARAQLIQAVARAVMEGDVQTVGIDGVDGAGKTTFADKLGSELRSQECRIQRLRADDFLNPPEVRHRLGRDSPEGFWLDSYDLHALASAVAQPREAVLIVDGLFLHRDELVDLWDLSVFLDVPFGLSTARVAKRDGTEPDPEHESQRRYVEGQKIYFRECSPLTRATLVIDNSDLERPQLSRY
ncbi:MAG: uridine kinase [Actinomycetota bacterium]|nr:uridine kinase [Actinomycetota bacterium]